MQENRLKKHTIRFTQVYSSIIHPKNSFIESVEQKSLLLVGLGLHGPGEIPGATQRRQEAAGHVITLALFKNIEKLPNFLFNIPQGNNPLRGLKNAQILRAKGQSVPLTVLSLEVRRKGGAVALQNLVRSMKATNRHVLNCFCCFLYLLSGILAIRDHGSHR